MMQRIVFLLVLIQSVSCLKAQKVEESFRYTNELIHEKSEYLQQHAHNPVDWMPWGEKAFEKAEKENKLVLISIGYSSCHWCHVMEKESFENEEIAAYMNKHFVCIKVDREERTDVDKMYMSAVSLIMKNTGWPLNCFTLSDGRPFYGGTYYSPGDWKKLMAAIVDMKHNTPEKITQFADELEEGIISNQFIPIDSTAIVISRSDLRSSVDNFKSQLDFQKGGLRSNGNKFPMSSNLNLIMNYAFLEKDTSLMNYVFTSLDRMSLGGIYDQIGGGFARYSTDVNWKIPHFEKMLYINAQLVSNYSDAYKISKDENYKRVVAQTVGWLEREMTNFNGGFYASQDADSDGKEGLFYTWTKSELKAVLGEDFEWMKNYFEVNPLGVFEGDRYVLIRSIKDEVFAKSDGWTLEMFYIKLYRNIAKLQKARSSRIKPNTDRKIVTPWNAMMISGLVDAYEAFDEERYLSLAKESMDNILNSYKKKGTLSHIIRQDVVSRNGYIDDYAFTIKALIDLYQVTFDEGYLKKANELTEISIKVFKDKESPYFIYAAVNNEILTRSIELQDNSIASSNAVMAENLFLLGLTFENENYAKMSKDLCLNMKSPFIANGISFSYWGKVMQYYSSSFYEVVLAGEDTKLEQRSWMQEFIPNAFLLGGKSKLPLLRENMNIKIPTIFVCKEKVCQKPVYTINEALELMPR